MEKTKNIIIVILSIIIVLLFTCNKKKECPSNIEYKEFTTIKHDTIFPDSTLYVLKSKLKPKAKDSIIIKTKEYTLIDHGICKYKRIYQDSLVDSNITLFYSDTVQGQLLGNSFKYRLKVPLKITTTIINTTDKTPKPKNQLYGGLELGGSKTAFNISPILMLRSKKDYIYSYRYDIINNTHNIGFTVNIFKKTKNN